MSDGLPTVSAARYPRPAEVDLGWMSRLICTGIAIPTPVLMSGEIEGQLRNPNVGNKRSPRVNDHGRRTGLTPNEAFPRRWPQTQPPPSPDFAKHHWHPKVRQNSAAIRLLQIDVRLKRSQRLRTCPRGGISETGAGRPVVMYALMQSDSYIGRGRR